MVGLYGQGHKREKWVGRDRRGRAHKPALVLVYLIMKNKEGCGHSQSKTRKKKKGNLIRSNYFHSTWLDSIGSPSYTMACNGDVLRTISSSSMVSWNSHWKDRPNCRWAWIQSVFENYFNTADIIRTWNRTSFSTISILLFSFNIIIYRRRLACPTWLFGFWLAVPTHIPPRPSLSLCPIQTSILWTSRIDWVWGTPSALLL